DRGVLRGNDLQPRIPPYVLGLLTVEDEADVGLALLEHRDPRRALGNALHDQSLHVRRMPPVLRVRFEDHLDTGHVADKLVGPGADRLLAEALLADLLDVLPGDHEAGGGRGGAVERHEIWPRLLEMKAHGRGIDDRHPLNARAELAGARALVPVEAELHVV